MNAQTPIAKATALNDIDALHASFARQRAAYAGERFPDLATRRDRLARLKALLKDNSEAIVTTISQDFRHRAHPETLLADVFASLELIAYCDRHLAHWMKPRKRRTGLTSKPGSSRIVPQPLGVVGIMAPWNYPVNLVAGPLAYALAAGNRALVRMSETTPRTTALMARLIAERFSPEEVQVFGGEAELAAAFAALPFDHLLFTGSTETGRKVMQAAAKNLTPVTLELGGKSPAILAPDYDAAEAAERVAWGKTLNAGQTCIAPDVAYVPENKLEAFADGLCAFFTQRHDGGTSDSFTSMATPAFRDRMAELVADARLHGATIRACGDEQTLSDAGKYPVTLVIDPGPEARIMREEIFGPLMLIRTYNALDEALAAINAGERPLSLYLFTHDDQMREKVLHETHAGGVTINDVILHISQCDLPFGGVGASGMGSYHGQEGFETFSHMKPVFHQRGIGSWTGVKMLYPPYGAIARRFTRLFTGK